MRASSRAEGEGEGGAVAGEGKTGADQAQAEGCMARTRKGTRDDNS